MVTVRIVDMTDGRLKNVSAHEFGPFDTKELAHEWVDTHVKPRLEGYGPTMRVEIEEPEPPTVEALHIALHGEVCPPDDPDCDFPLETRITENK